MTRRSRTVTFTPEPRQKVISTIVDDNCGVTVDEEQAYGTPEGWWAVFHKTEDAGESFHFHDWLCLFGWVAAHDTEEPSDLLDKLRSSVAAATKAREERA